MPELDPAYYPHVFGAILFHTLDRKTILAARLVSTAMLKVADRTLALPEMYIRTNERGGGLQGFSYALNTWWDDRGRLAGGRLPCFCPDSLRDNTKPQVAAITMASYLDIIPLPTEAANKQLIDFLKHMRPTCSVFFKHHRNDRYYDPSDPPKLAYDLVIAPCQKLVIHMLSVCACRSTGVFKHSAESVRVTFLDDATPGVVPDCAVIAGIVNPGVNTITIEGNVLAFPRLLTSTSVQASPELRVTFSPDCLLEGEDRRQLLRWARKCFNIPQHQISFD